MALPSLPYDHQLRWVMERVTALRNTPLNERQRENLHYLLSIAESIKTARDAALNQRAL